MANDNNQSEDSPLGENEITLIEKITQDTIENLVLDNEIDKSNIDICEKTGFMVGCSVMQIIKSTFYELKKTYEASDE